MTNPYYGSQNLAPHGAQPHNLNPQPAPYSWVRTGDARADQQIRDFLTLMEPHWTWMFVVFLVVLSLTVVPFFHWVGVLGWQTSLAFVITFGFLFFFLRSKRPKKGWRRVLQIAGLIMMPAALPYIFGLYVVLVPRNLDERLQNHFYPPTIYYINAMVEEEFGDEGSVLRAHAGRWNPDNEKSQAVRDFMLLSARYVEIRAQKIKPFETAPEDGEVNVVVFQNSTAPASPDKLTSLLSLLKRMKAEMEDAGPEKKAGTKGSQPSELQPRLNVCFLAGVSAKQLRNVENEEELKELPIACRTAPANLDLDFAFFVKGFAAAAKKEVKIEHEEDTGEPEKTKKVVDGQPSSEENTEAPVTDPPPVEDAGVSD